MRPGNGMVASEVMTAEVASYQSKSTYHDSCLSSSLTQRYHPRISVATPREREPEPEPE